MKRIFEILLSVIFCLSFLSVGAVAETEGTVDFEYTVGSEGVTITKYVGAGGNLVIPDTIEGKPVIAIGGNAFPSGNDSAGTPNTSLHIPKTVTTLEHGALYGCFNAMVYTVDVENPAFKAVDGVLFTKDETTLVRYPAGRSDDSYTIPNGVTAIESYAFACCENLTSIHIPDSVTIIKDRGFYGCDALTAITIPKGVTTIEDAAFWACTNLVTLNIPAGVTTIGAHAFSYCRGLTSVTVGANGSVTAERGTVIGKRAFSSCSNLATLTIGNGVSTIGNHAFYWCDKLTTLILEEGVSNIGEGAFENCRALASVTFPSSVTTIERAAFYYCDSLTTVTIPESVTTIGRAAFAFVTNGCTTPAPMEGFVIKGVVGSAAQTYAFENEIIFEEVTATDVPQPPVDVETPTDVVALGDVNNDQKIDAKDALEVLKATVGKVELTPLQITAADMNEDGTIDAKDALQILRKVVGK